MTSISVVRKATSDDTKELWRLFREHHKENGLFPLSEPKVQFYLDRVLQPGRIADDDTGPRGIIGVIGSVGALEGAIMLVLEAPWYTDTVALGDCMNYVDQRHRNSHHAKALIGYAKHIVDEIRATSPDFRMVLGIVSNVRTAAKIRLYEKHLTAPVGAFYMYPKPAGFRPIKRTHLVKRPSSFGRATT